MIKKLKSLAIEKKEFLDSMFIEYVKILERYAHDLSVQFNFEYDEIVVSDVDFYEWDKNLGFRFSIDYYRKLNEMEIMEYIEHFDIHPDDDDDFENTSFCDIQMSVFSDGMWAREINHENSEIAKKLEKFLEKVY